MSPAARPGDKWHLDEVFIKVNGRMRYLWRAVDQDGNVLDTLVQSKRDGAAFPRISTLLRPRRHLITASDYRAEMAERLRVWKSITGQAATA